MKRSASLRSSILVCAVAALVYQTAVPATSGGLAGNALKYTRPALVLGAATSLFSSETEGVDRASRASESVVLSVGLARLIKHSADMNLGGRNPHSFPSGHAAAAFAMAHNLAHIKPKHKWTYYGCAMLIGWSTVKTNSHGWADVAGGAALGITVSNMSMNSRHGLLLNRVVYRF